MAEAIANSERVVPLDSAREREAMEAAIKVRGWTGRRPSSEEISAHTATFSTPASVEKSQWLSRTATTTTRNGVTTRGMTPDQYHDVADNTLRMGEASYVKGSPKVARIKVNGKG